jgi:hypothetical protein
MAAPASANFAISPEEGVDFGATYTISTSTPEYPAAPFAAGTHWLGSNGSEYVFAQTSTTAVPQYSACALDKSYIAAVVATGTSVTNQLQIGFPQASNGVPASSYGWFAIRGEQIGVLARKGSLANLKLYVSSVSAGVLTSLSVRTSSLVTGITLTTSSTSLTAATSSVTVANATWPRSLV